MKRFFSILLALVMLFSVTACSTATPTPSGTTAASPSADAETTPTPTPTPTPSDDPTPTPSPTPTPIPVSEDVKALGDYVIIYSEKYEAPRQMREVELLQDVIEKLSGKRPQAQKDSDGALTNKNYIIFASSDVKTSCDSTFDALEDEMDYAICIDDDKNVILGGKTYYSDMRAAYEFINNYLGYDDLEDVYALPTKELSGQFVSKYVAPKFIIAAHNAFHQSFTPKFIKEARDCNINLMSYNLSTDPKYWVEENYKDIATWCVRFGMYFMVDAYADANNEVTIRSEEFMLNNPMVYAAHLRDEPGPEILPAIHAQVESYNSKYSQYGIKCYVNHFYSFEVWESLEENGYLDNLQVTGFDRYARNYNLTYAEWLDYINFLKIVRRVTGDKIDFWMYLESFNLKNNGITVYTAKSFRFASYLAMCFGAKGVNYFCYADLPYYKYEGDWSHGQLLEDDFTPTKAWYDAQRTNEELMKLAEIYSLYTNTGAYLLGKDPNGAVAEENRYTGFDDVLVEALDKNGNEITAPYLVGCFDKKDGDGKAFMVLNLAELNAQSYTTTRGVKVKLKINGENVTFYQDGEIIDVAQDENGYYTPIIANGTAVFVTVD